MHTTIILMNNGIEDGFTQSFLRYFQWFESSESFVMNGGGKILGTQHFNDFVCHTKNVALYHILKDKISLVLNESSNAKITQRKVARRSFTEQKKSSISEVTLFIYQIKTF